MTTTDKSSLPAYVGVPAYEFQIPSSKSVTINTPAAATADKTNDTYPHPSGDAVILGPETFADKGKTVICHQGENYYPRPLADDTYLAGDADGTPCLWLLTPGGNGRTELLLAKDDLWASVTRHKPNASWGAPSRDVYVDRLWDAIAATAGEAPEGEL